MSVQGIRYLFTAYICQFAPKNLYPTPKNIWYIVICKIYILHILYIVICNQLTHHKGSSPLFCVLNGSNTRDRELMIQNTIRTSNWWLYTQTKRKYTCNRKWSNSSSNMVSCLFVVWQSWIPKTFYQWKTSRLPPFCTTVGSFYQNRWQGSRTNNEKKST